ncbi:aminotransferase class-V domain-containing protein [Sarocladium implicatum]|nr:aminotransferase class-V domain-containing protein [Sarocladium implicatum]
MGENVASTPVNFGKETLDLFLLDPKWKNLNNGSFGTIPKFIQDKQRTYQSLAEARPDQFIRKDYVALLNESRAAVAQLINAPVSEVVFCSNATVAVNTIYKNLTWNDDGKDTIISFSTIYGGCGKTEDWVVDTQNGKVKLKEIELVYPLEDEEIIQMFRDKVKEIEAEGLRPKICLFDVVSSSPGVVFPWVAMTKACRELNVLSLVDGAQGVGMVPLDMQAADPDFFFSNCHKWLFTPRGSAVFYVPERNQHLIPTTLATNSGYIARHRQRWDALPHAEAKGSNFVNQFAFNGTMDDTPYVCVKDAIAWRRDVLGGEERIMAYMTKLNKEGCALVAKEVGGAVLENKAGTLNNSAMGNIMLPIWVGQRGEGAGADDLVVSKEETAAVFQWLEEKQVSEYNTFMAFFVRWDRFMVRLSAQVYLDMDDYKWAAATLKEMVGRVAKGEYKK